MIGQDPGFFVGAKPYDFTADDGKRLVGASMTVAHKPSLGDKVMGLRSEIYSVGGEVLAILDDLKPFHEYVFGIELRPGWKKGKIVTVSEV
jgi:hypothetical protein